MQTEKEKGLSIGSSKKKILIKYYYERIRRDVTNFIKWMLLAILTGLVVGGASSAFAACISAATEYRNSHLWVFLCLPLAGIVIVFMYERLGRQDGGTNQVLSTIKSKCSLYLCPTDFYFYITDASDRRFCRKGRCIDPVWRQYRKLAGKAGASG